MWKMMLFDKLFASSDKGHLRIRHLQTLFHAAACLAIYWVVLVITQNQWAALTGGLLYSFYGTSPDLTAGSFNFEQFYIPFIFAGLTFLLNGEIFYAGLCFGFAVIGKCTMIIYGGVLTPIVWISYGETPALIFCPCNICRYSSFQFNRMGTRILGCPIHKTNQNAHGDHHANNKNKIFALQHLL